MFQWVSIKMPLEQDVLDIGKQLEKIVADGNSVRFLCLFVFFCFFVLLQQRILTLCDLIPDEERKLT